MTQSRSPLTVSESAWGTWTDGDGAPRDAARGRRDHRRDLDLEGRRRDQAPERADRLPDRRRHGLWEEARDDAPLRERQGPARPYREPAVRATDRRRAPDHRAAV